MVLGRWEREKEREERDNNMSEGYGSIRGGPGGTTGRENLEVYQERRRMETLEHSDEKVTIKKYLLFGSVLAVLATLALYTLWGRVSAQIAHISQEKADVAASKAKVGGTESHRRLLIKHLLQRPAIEQAQSYTWEQIEDWGKKHPTEPVHNGMILILDKDPAKYKEIVQQKVEQSLTNIQKCDANNVCKSNPIASFIQSRACPMDRPCPHETLDDIRRLSKWAARIAVDGAFQGLHDQIKEKPPNPFTHHGGQTRHRPAMPYPPSSSSPIALTPPSYRQAADTGMGYQPGGYQPVPRMVPASLH